MEQERAIRPTAASPRALRWTFVLLLVPYAWMVARFDFLSDDAYINFRYAKNLADGWGLTFNPAPGPMVEAYNFLWTLLMTIPELLGADTGLWSKVGTVASGVALLWIVLRTCARSFGSSTVALAGTGLFLVTLAPYAVFSTSGMEAMPTALFIFLAYERLLADPERPRGWQAGMAAAVAALMRPDGMLYTASVCIAGALTALFLKRRGLLGQVGRTALLLAATVLAHTLFRYLYHGDFVPNTVRVKGQLSREGLERGWDYLCTLLLAFPGLIAMLFLVPLALGAKRIHRGLPVALILAAFLTYCILVGADFMPMGRFLLAALPFFALALALAFDALEQCRPRPAWVALLALLLVSLSLPTVFDRPLAPLALRQRHDYRWGQSAYVSEVQAWANMKGNTERWLREGKALAKHTKAGESLVRGPIGCVGYETDLVLHDLFGLTDREIARLAPGAEGGPGRRTMAGHTREVPPAFFLPRRPTYYAMQMVPLAQEAYLLLSIDPDTYAQGRMEWIERHELDPREFTPEQGFAEPTVLRLHRLVELNPAFDLLLPWIEAAHGIDTVDPAAAEALLLERVAPDSAAAKALGRWIAGQREQPSHAAESPSANPARPPPAEFDWLVDVHWLAGAGRGHRHPEGEINVLFPLEGAPSIDGRTHGYLVMPPGSAHALNVSGGAMGILTLRPAAAR